jgi:hypothetical protein
MLGALQCVLFIWYGNDGTGAHSSNDYRFHQSRLTLFNIKLNLIVKSASDASRFEQLPVANNILSLSLKLIGKSILEGALFSPTTLQAFEYIGALTLSADFQLIVDLF